MTRILILAGAALALSAGATLGAEMVQIKTEAEFRKLIVGKKMTHEWDGYMLFQADNHTTGTYKGRKIGGIWNWTGNTFCRTMLLDEKNFGFDCRTVAIKGNTVTITRKAGKGKPFNLTITDK